MKEKILALLTEMFPDVRKDGLIQLARIFALQVSSEEEAKALVEKLTQAQVDEFVRTYRIDVDMKAAEMQKMLEAKLNQRFDFVEKKSDPNSGGDDSDYNEKEEDMSNMAAIIEAALAVELNPIKQELASFKTSETSKARLQLLNDKLTGCKDETFKAKALKDFARMKFETDDEFQKYLSETGNDILTANQNVADAALSKQGKPLFTQKNDTGISQSVAEFVVNLKTEAKTLSGKEV
jgi:hypothetical protein